MSSEITIHRGLVTINLQAQRRLPCFIIAGSPSIGRDSKDTIERLHNLFEGRAGNPSFPRFRLTLTVLPREDLALPSEIRREAERQALALLHSGALDRFILDALDNIEPPSYNPNALKE